MLHCFNNWNIIKISNKTTTSEDFETIHQVILGGISENMFSLVQPGKYGATSTTYPTKLGYYVVKYVSEACILQEKNTRDGKISTPDKLLVKAKYLICMKEKKNWYLEKIQQQKIIFLTTNKIVNSCLDFIVVNYVQDIIRSVFNQNQACQALNRRPVCINESNHDYIIYGILRQDQIDQERNNKIKYTDD